MIKVLFVYSDRLCSTTKKRCFEPYISLLNYKKSSIQTNLINYLFLNELHIVDNDVIILQRFGANRGKISKRYEEELFGLMKKYPNKKFIYDIDDLVFHYNDGQPMRFIENCQDVITTGSFLKSKISEKNKNTHIIKNYIDQELFEKAPIANFDKAKVNISWMSGNACGMDIVKDLIPKLESKYEETVRIYAFSAEPFNTQIANWNSKIVQTCGIVEPSIMFAALKSSDILINPMDINESTFSYLGIYEDQHRLDFVNSKSDIKYIKAGAAGIPLVTTPNSQYSESIIDGVNGFLPSSAEQWFETLCFLINNPQKRQEVGAAAKADIYENFTLKSLADDYEEMLMEILDV